MPTLAIFEVCPCKIGHCIIHVLELDTLVLLRAGSEICWPFVGFQVHLQYPMRAVIQRVTQASVVVDGTTVGAIGEAGIGGVLIFLGVGQNDHLEDADWLVRRVVQLRIFEDADGRMNRSLLDIGGRALVVSQFTLYGSLKKGNRPSFNRAALPDKAIPIYEHFVSSLSVALGKPVPTGCFGEHMDVEAHNDGPVTLIVDTKDRNF